MSSWKERNGEWIKKLDLKSRAREVPDTGVVLGMEEGVVYAPDELPSIDIAAGVTATVSWGKGTLLELLEMARSFTRRFVVVLFKITLPLLMPYIISAVRIAYGVGWKIALVAELFGSESGLGFLLQQAQSVADAATVFATCFAIVIIFWVGEKIAIDPLSRKFSLEKIGA